MKLGELYVPIIILLHAQKYFYIKLLCMHDARTCNIVAKLKRCTLQCLNPTSHIFRGSAVESALDLESKGP